MDRPERHQVELSGSVELTLAGELDLPSGKPGREEHSHPFWELLLMVEGDTAFRSGGLKLRFNQRKAILIPPMVAHRIDAGSSPVEMLYLCFDVEPPFLFAEPREIDCVGEFAWLATELQPALKAMLRKQSKSSSQVLLLLCRMVEQLALGVDGVLRKSRGSILVEKAKRLMEDKLSGGICVKELASMFYLTPHHFGELFRAEAGVSIKEWHRKLRMEKALAMLRSSEESIGEISADLGYSTQQAFSRDFKSVFGVSPSMYRSPLPNFPQNR